MTKFKRVPDVEFFHMILHGGIGDGIWVLKKAINFGKPLYITISSENRHRPRRSAALYEHVPQVFGWDYSDKSFAEGGQDWTQSAGDPACAMDVTWEELAAPRNKPFRIECNRWLESGRRLDDWLPDLPTTHNFKFATPGLSNLAFRKPCIVFHIAGWPDLHDGQWTTLIDLFRGTAHVYIVGGSYDRRPRQIYTQVAGRGGATLMEDVAWEDLVGVLSACDYCFGHASGFTAIADVMRIPGVVINPRSVPRLNGTWNSPDNPDQVHVNTPEEFSSAVYQAFRKMAGSDRATWPPTGIRGSRLTSAGDPLGAVKAAAQAARPKQAAIYANEGHHAGIGAAVLDGAFSVGAIVSSIHMVGCAQDAVTAVNREAARSTRKPIVTTGSGPWPAGRGNETFDLIVVITSGPPAFAAQCVRDAWRSVSPAGTLLFSGTYAASAAEALGAGLAVKPQTVANADGWWFIHRRS